MLVDNRRFTTFEGEEVLEEEEEGEEREDDRVWRWRRLQQSRQSAAYTHTMTNSSPDELECDKKKSTAPASAAETNGSDAKPGNATKLDRAQLQSIYWGGRYRFRYKHTERGGNKKN